MLFHIYSSIVLSALSIFNDRCLNLNLKEVRSESIENLCKC